MSFCFIHIPKCGGSSICDTLECRHPDGDKQHQTLEDILTQVSVDVFNKSFSFTVIRNPWDRVVSWYHFFNTQITNKTDHSFNDWVLNDCPFLWNSGNSKLQWMEQHRFYIDQYEVTERVKIKKIYKLHELEQHWPEICDNTIRRQIELVKTNISTHDDYRNYYNKETKEIIRIRCEIDIDINKWTFDNG